MKMPTRGLVASGLALMTALLFPTLAADLRPQSPATSAGGLSAPEADRAASPVSAAPSVKLSLRDAVSRAVEGNLDIRVARFTPQQSEQDEIAARAFFDPASFGTYRKNKENQEPTNFLGTSSSEFDTYTLGLTQQFVTGGTATLTFNNTRSDVVAVFPINFNPSYTSSLNLSFTQPLLQGLGARSERNSIRIARNNVKVSESQLRDTVMNTVKQVTDAYWDLVAAIRDLEVAEESLGLARELLDLNKAKVEVGTLAPIEITQAEAGVASREEAVIVAENAIRTAEDNLRRILNAPKDSGLWRSVIEPTDEPTFDVPQIDMDAEVASALANRPDLEQQRIGLRTLELEASSARDDVRPSLDLTGSYGLAGTAGDQRFNKLDLTAADPVNFPSGIPLDGIPDCDTRDPNCSGIPVDRDGDGKNDVIFVEETISDAWDQLTDRDLISWSAGLNFSFPIGNRAARARHARSRIAVDQARVSLESAERTVEIEVRNSVRQVRTNVKRVQAAQKSVDLQREKLEAEQKRFQYGMTTSFQVLEFQTDLSEARAALTRAFLDYEKSLTALADATGTLLEKNDIEVN